MSVKFSVDAKLYFCAAGIGGTPEWTEIKNVRNVTSTVQTSEQDVTVRGNNGWKAVVSGLREASIEFEMIWDTTDTGFSAIKDAFFNRTVIGIAAMDGDIAAAGNQGLWADCMVTQFSREESLEQAMSVKVTVKPTYSANAPIWKTVAA